MFVLSHNRLIAGVEGGGIEGDAEGTVVIDDGQLVADIDIVIDSASQAQLQWLTIQLRDNAVVAARFTSAVYILIRYLCHIALCGMEIQKVVQLPNGPNANECSSDNDSKGTHQAVFETFVVPDIQQQRNDRQDKDPKHNKQYLIVTERKIQKCSHG